jgi:hypothetical protein
VFGPFRGNGVADDLEERVFEGEEGDADESAIRSAGSVGRRIGGVSTTEREKENESS